MKSCNKCNMLYDGGGCPLCACPEYHDVDQLTELKSRLLSLANASARRELLEQEIDTCSINVMKGAGINYGAILERLSNDTD